MTPKLQELMREAGAPEQVMDKLWFNVFCQKFAYVLADAMGYEIVNEDDEQDDEQDSNEKQYEITHYPDTQRVQ